MKSRIKLRKLLALVLVAGCLVGSTLTVGATDTVITEGSADKTAATAVTIAGGTITSSFSISVPNTAPMTVNGVAKTASKVISITVSGETAGNETVEISGIKTFNLTQSGKSNVPVTLSMSIDGSYTDIVTEGTISAANDAWRAVLSSTQVAASTSVLVKLDATGVSAGSYAGTANFKAALVSN
jgi:hypothetical protein